MTEIFFETIYLLKLSDEKQFTYISNSAWNLITILKF